MGRKKVKTEEKIDIRLRVDEKFRAKIQAAADEDQTTVAAFIRALIVREFKRREKGGND